MYLFIGIVLSLQVSGQTLRDTTIVNELYQRSRKFWNHTPDSALSLLRKSEDLARKIGAEKTQAKQEAELNKRNLLEYLVIAVCMLVLSY